MDFWCKTIVVTPDGGMCQVTTRTVKQSRASQLRECASCRLGASADMVNCDYAKTCLNLQLRIPKKNLKNVYGDWWVQINDFDSDKSLFLH